MCDDTRYFRVEGKVYVDREDVIDWQNDEIGWSESNLFPID